MQITASEGSVYLLSLSVSQMRFFESQLILCQQPHLIKASGVQKPDFVKRQLQKKGIIPSVPAAISGSVQVLRSVAGRFYITSASALTICTLTPISEKGLYSSSGVPESVIR